jgi:glycosyltransferase involved in cell wall biosynthesis
LRVCIDLSPTVHRRAGWGTYARELSTALNTLEDRPDLTLFYNAPSHGQPLPPALTTLPNHILSLPTRPWRLVAALSQQLDLGLDRWLPHCGVFHATEHLLPRLKRAQTVLTVHDLIFALFPEHHLPMNQWFLGQFMPIFVRRADAIVTVSECSKRDLLQLYGTRESKITVIPEGVDERFHVDPGPEAVATIRQKYGLVDPFILYVGTIEPRKNLITLLEAFKRLQVTGCNLKLVIAGRAGWLYQPFFDRLKALGLGDTVRLLGYVPDVDLPALYRAAEVFVFPSLYEGFGLPPLEAMACGTPVVCSNASSLPEVVGDAGLLVPPDDVAGLAAAIGRVLTDPALRAELSARGRERAARFTWEEAARRTLEVYRRISREHRD